VTFALSLSPGGLRLRSLRAGVRLGLGLALASVVLVSTAVGTVEAQSTENAEARAFFEQGNRSFERSQRVASGSRRIALLEEALAAYVASLAIVRSKNALFNAGVTLAELGRGAEAYSYFGEYLALSGLTEEERAAADAQRAALLGRVMMVSVRSTPSGAEVRVDRADLQALGRTPVDVPLDPGEHVVLVRGADGRDRAHRVLAVAGEAGTMAETETVAETEAETEIGAESRYARVGAWSATGALALGAFALRLRAGRQTRAHEALATGAGTVEERTARGEVLYERIVRANRTSQVLTGLAVVGLGVSVGLSVRARRVARARLRVVVNGELAGVSLGLAGELR